MSSGAYGAPLHQGQTTAFFSSSTRPSRLGVRDVVVSTTRSPVVLSMVMRLVVVCIVTLPAGVSMAVRVFCSWTDVRGTAGMPGGTPDECGARSR